MDLTVQPPWPCLPLDMGLQDLLLLTSDGHHWSPVQTYLPHTNMLTCSGGTDTVGTSGWHPTGMLCGHTDNDYEFMVNY